MTWKPKTQDSIAKVNYYTDMVRKSWQQQQIANDKADVLNRRTIWDESNEKLRPPPGEAILRAMAKEE